VCQQASVIKASFHSCCCNIINYRPTRTEKERKEEKRRGNDLPEAENKRGGEREKVEPLFDRWVIELKKCNPA